MKATLFVMPALVVAAPASAQEQPAASPPANANAIHNSIQVCETAHGENRIQLQAGRRYLITASSEAFDPVMHLLRPGSDEPLAEDDDSGGGTSPRIVFAPTQSGDYIVRVTSYSPGGAGDYDLNVAEAPPLPPVVTRATGTERAQWQVFQGDLSDGDAQETNRRYDDYQLQLAAGQSAILQVQAQDVDTMLQVFTADGRGVTPIAEDDDSGGGTNPMLFFTPDEAGTYVVRVIGYGEDTRGAYRLRVLR